MTVPEGASAGASDSGSVTVRVTASQAEAGDPQADGSSAHDSGAGSPAARGRWRRWLVIAAWTAGFAVTFVANLLLSRTNATNSDGAGRALQGWDLLHGNILLHTWFTSDLPVYTTEVPEYALVVALHGLNADAVHVAAALSYTLAMLLATLIAIGRSRGREALVRGAIAAGIMVAPQLAAGTYTLLNLPDHFGTSVPMLLAWLVVDRAPKRWWTPVLVGLILSWAGFGDLSVCFVAALPLAVTCGYRALRGWRADHEPLAAQRYLLAMAAAGLVAAMITLEAPSILNAIGGLGQSSAGTQLSPLSVIFWHNIRVTIFSWLMIFGAYFIGVRQHVQLVLALLHLVGAALGAIALVLGLKRYPREQDLTTQLLVASIAFLLVAFAAGGHSVELSYGREISPCLPFAAALAGRLFGRPLLASGLAPRVLRPVLAVALCGYLVGFGYDDSQPKVPPQNVQIADWLEAHHFHYGLSGYWAADVVTLTTADKVEIRPIDPISGKSKYMRPARPLVESTWFDPRLHYANFVVLYKGPIGTPPFTAFTGVGSFDLTGKVLATFGKPARTYHDGRYTILVWNKNLLADMEPFSPTGP
jgi:hypothetical protein